MNRLMAPLFYPCAKIPDFAYDYLEHRLPLTTSLRFRAHIGMCKGCAEFMRLYGLAADPVKFLQETPAPPDLIEKTLQFVEENQKSEVGSQETGPNAGVRGADALG